MLFSKNNSYRNYFTDRFGIDEAYMARFDFYEHGRNVWAYSGTYIQISNTEVVGMRALRVKKMIKPTTAFIRVIGAHATRNVIELNREERILFMQGARLSGEFDAEHGYVIVVSENDILGCGLLSKKGLESQIPSKYREEQSWV